MAKMSQTNFEYSMLAATRCGSKLANMLSQSIFSALANEKNPIQQTAKNRQV